MVRRTGHHEDRDARGGGGEDGVCVPRVDLTVGVEDAGACGLVAAVVLVGVLDVACKERAVHAPLRAERRHALKRHVPLRVEAGRVHVARLVESELRARLVAPVVRLLQVLLVHKPLALGPHILCRHKGGKSVHVVRVLKVGHDAADLFDVAPRARARRVVALCGELRDTVACEVGLVVPVLVPEGGLSEERRQLAAALRCGEHELDLLVPVCDVGGAVGRPTDVVVRHSVGRRNDVVVPLHVHLGTHRCGRCNRCVHKVRELEAEPSRKHAGVRPSEGHPLGSRKLVLRGGELVETGKVAQGLAGGEELKTTLGGGAGHGACGGVVAPVVAVLDGEHDGVLLCEVLHSNVAVHARHHHGAVQRGTLTTDTQEHRAPGSVERGVHEVRLRPRVLVGPVEVVLVLREELRSRKLHVLPRVVLRPHLALQLLVVLLHVEGVQGTGCAHKRHQAEKLHICYFFLMTVVERGLGVGVGVGANEGRGKEPIFFCLW